MCRYSRSELFRISNILPSYLPLVYESDLAKSSTANIVRLLNEFGSEPDNGASLVRNVVS